MMEDLIKLFRIKPKAPKSPEVEPYELVKGVRYVILYRPHEIARREVLELLEWLTKQGVEAIAFDIYSKDGLQIFEIQEEESP